MTPCVMYDTAADEELLQDPNVGQITMLNLNDGNRPARDGPKLFADRSNAQNGGKGFAVGFKRDKFVRIRMVAVMTGYVNCEESGSAYRNYSSSVMTWLLSDPNSGVSEAAFVVGGDSSYVENAPGVKGEIDTVNDLNRIYLAQSGPNSIYEAARERGNQFTFGMHLSSYQYTYGVLKQLSFEGVKTYAVAGRDRSAFFKTTCDFADIFASQEFGMKNVTQRIVYGGVEEKWKDREYQTQVAQTMCADSPDLLIGCINHDEAGVWEAAWEAMQCKPKAVWLTCVAWGCLKSTNKHKLFTTGTQWSTKLAYGDDFFVDNEDFAAALTDTFGSHTVGSNTAATYASAQVFQQIVQIALRNADVEDVKSTVSFFSPSPSQGTVVASNPQLYETVRRELSSLRIDKSIYGPIQMDIHGRNAGRQPVSIQIQGEGADWAQETIAPSEASSSKLLFPNPVTAPCTGNTALSWGSGSCYLCDQCKECEEGYIPTADHSQCVEQGALDANTSEQRTFWTTAVIFLFFSSLASIFLAFNYAVNPALKTPITRSYLAISIPDVIMCVVFFPFYIANLYRGEPTPEDACVAVGFLSYGIVIATFFGPVTLAFVTFRKFSKVAANDFRGDPVTSSQLAVMVAVPWILGFVLAGVVYSQGLLGSFRGLYCYTNDWNHALTGGLTIGILIFSCLLTAGLYTRTFFIIKTVMNGKTDDNVKAVLWKGASLVAVLFGTWALFSIAGLATLAGAKTPVALESAGACIIFVQPIIDCIIVMRSRPVWKGFLSYLATIAGAKIAQTVATKAPVSRVSSGDHSRASAAKPTLASKAKHSGQTSGKAAASADSQDKDEKGRQLTMSNERTFVIVGDGNEELKDMRDNAASALLKK